MCGIAGFLNRQRSSQPVSERELEAVRDRMAARGPDDEGLWLDPAAGVGLAHRRLSIIDLSEAGHQPMEDPETGNRITFNGEIYNYRELREELRSAGHVFRSTSDTEVILHLYRREGVAMLSKLRGMFAFAIWDARDRALILARDLYGIKPLYYADVGGTFLFASQVRAMRTFAPLKTGAPSPAAKVAFFLFGHVPEPITFFSDIASVPAGCWLRVADQGVHPPVAYASIAQALQPQRKPAMSRPERVELIAAALQDSVRHHMIADVPVGVFLSAGRDSTALAALASRHVAEPLRTVTLSFEEFAGTPHDEAPLAEEVARALGTDHRTVRIGRADFEADFDRILDAMDQPTIDGINVYFVSKAAAGAGLKVALSGLGGDELFGGYGQFQTIPHLVARLGGLRQLPAVGQAVRRLTSPWLSMVGRPKYAGLVEYGTRVSDAYLLARSLFAPWELPAIMNRDEVETGLAVLGEVGAVGDVPDWDGSGHAQLVMLESSRYMRNQLLRDSDWASMAHSLEVRVPLVDSVLLSTLAPMIGSAQPPTKDDMFESVRACLPPETAGRAKSGFGIPVGNWSDALPSRSAAVPGSMVGRGGKLRSWAFRVYDRFLQTA